MNNINIPDNWKEIPPKYENLKFNNTAEFVMAEEFNELKDKLMGLTDLANSMHQKFVNGLQQETIKTWDEAIKINEKDMDIMNEKLEEILRKFFY